MICYEIFPGTKAFTAFNIKSCLHNFVYCYRDSIIFQAQQEVFFKDISGYLPYLSLAERSRTRHWQRVESVYRFFAVMIRPLIRLATRVWIPNPQCLIITALSYITPHTLEPPIIYSPPPTTTPYAL